MRTVWHLLLVTTPVALLTTLAVSVHYELRLLDVLFERESARADAYLKEEYIQRLLGGGRWICDTKPIPGRCTYRFAPRRQQR